MHDYLGDGMILIPRSNNCLGPCPPPSLLWWFVKMPQLVLPPTTPSDDAYLHWLRTNLTHFGQKIRRNRVQQWLGEPCSCWSRGNEEAQGQGGAHQEPGAEPPQQGGKAGPCCGMAPASCCGLGWSDSAEENARLQMASVAKKAASLGRGVPSVTHCHLH